MKSFQTRSQLLKIGLGLLALLTAMTACSMPEATGGRPPAETPAGPGAAAQTPVGPDLPFQSSSKPQGYPLTPDEVVQAFLQAHQTEPDQMLIFLSSRQLAQMPSGGAAQLLQIGGALEEFAIQAASVSPEPPAAMVIVSLETSETKAERTFFLLQDGGYWVIDAIEP